MRSMVVGACQAQLQLLTDANMPRAPSTALRAVPLPRNFVAGEDKSRALRFISQIPPQSVSAMSGVASTLQPGANLSFAPVRFCRSSRLKPSMISCTTMPSCSTVITATSV